MYHHRNHLFKVYVVEIERVRKLLLFHDANPTAINIKRDFRNSLSLKFLPQPIINYLRVTNWATDVPDSRGRMKPVSS